jgi:UrcA family protein
MIAMLSTFALFLAPVAANGPDVRIAYADLNLASEAGRAEFNRRIDRAVNTVCPEAPTRLLAEVQAVRRCRADARMQIDAQRNAR